MYSEDLFNEWLANRAEMHGKKINTERSVKMARNKLEGWGNEGYDCDAIITHCIEKSYRGLFKIPGQEPRQSHLRPSGALREMAAASYQKMPKGPSSAQKQAIADARRKAGEARLEALKAVGLK